MTKTMTSLKLENTKEFIKRYHAEETSGLFDVLPDEILYTILEKYMISVETYKYIIFEPINESLYKIFLTCRRFERIMIDVANRRKYKYMCHHKTYKYFLELTYNWVEKILSFGYFSSYRCLLISIIQNIRGNLFSKEGNCVVLTFMKNCQYHSFIISNNLYYYRCKDIIMPSFPQDDSKINKSMIITDYNLRKFTIAESNVMSIYTSIHSKLVVSSFFAELIYKDKHFIVNNNKFDYIQSGEYKFWSPIRGEVCNEIYDLIFSEFSPLPIEILNYFKQEG